jgi:hypothetical protein
MMPSFFTTLSDIQQHASFVKRRYSLECAHCGEVGHLIAHGFVYKQVSMLSQECIGKRLVCCRRFGHAGCGRTMQLSLSSQLPRRFYSGIQLGVFIVLLLSNVAVSHAYTQATGQLSTRHAWRWLAALKANLWCYRSKVTYHVNTRFASPLLDVLSRCLPLHPKHLCLDFQFRHQIPFF